MTCIDWEIRAAGPRDHALMRALLLEGFPTPDEADLVERLRESGATVIEFLAEADGRIVGAVVLSAMQQPEGTLGLGPVVVDASFRRNGIAASLIESGLALAAADDWRGVFVLGDLSYYGRFGFSADAAEGFAAPYPREHFGLAILDPDDPPAGAEAVYAAPFSTL